MIEAAKAIWEIGNTAGRNDKEALLKKHANVEGFKEILHFIFNPYIRTGIGKAKLKKMEAVMAATSTTPTYSWQQALDYFNQNATGRDEDIVFGWCFITSSSNPEVCALAEAIVTKDLTIGVSDKTLNKVFGKTFIPKMGLMLGMKWEDEKTKAKGPFIVTEKYDGQRRILVKENGKVALYSRSGIPDTGLVEIEAEAKHLPDNCVYDGELLAIGEFEDAIALRQATNSIASRDGEKVGLNFMIFDMISIDDFKEGISKHGARQRKILLGATLDDNSIIHLVDSVEMSDNLRQTFGHNAQFLKRIQYAPILGIAQDEYGVLEFAHPIWGRGFEGVMLNTMEGKYEMKRSRELLKVKLVKSMVLKVIDQEEGEGRNEGRLGNLVLEYKGQRVGCGSGLNDAQRDAWWETPIVGQWVEIETFGESTDSKTGLPSLNCAIFKRLVKMDSE